jgi:hydrogenase maturation factor
MGAELPEIGKISPEIFEELIFPQLGKKDRRVLVGPQHGVDVGIVDLGGGKVMATTTDPVFIVPQYGWERAAWFAIHILVSDAVTSGLPPKYLTIDLNLPRSMTKEALEVVWSTIHRECKQMGIAVISGHTARYDGCNYPMVGGATVICIGKKKDYVAPTMAGVGDLVIVTKGAAIEATGLFAATFRPLIVEKFGEEFAKSAEKIFYQMSVVEDARTAVSVGVRKKGVTAMHDATECGVWGGLFEIAQASGVGMRIEKEKIVVLPEVEKICAEFGMDPYTSISEGTLIITCKEKKAEAVIEALVKKGIRSSIVGEVVGQRKGIKLVEKGIERTLEHPRVDPFWTAFGRTMEQVAKK